MRGTIGSAVNLGVGGMDGGTMGFGIIEIMAGIGAGATFIVRVHGAARRTPSGVGMTVKFYPLRYE